MSIAALDCNHMNIDNALDSPARVPALALSNACQVWGQSQAAAASFTWRAATGEEHDKAALERDGFRCRFCGFRSSHNTIHHGNDLHSDNHPDNLWACDSVCHGWNHLGEIDDQLGVIAYLPGISAADINHLQRAVMVALQAGDESDRTAAMDILNWAASHCDYVKPAWGTSSPKKFAEALSKQRDHNRELREFAFAGLALIYHPGVFAQQATLWVSEAYAAYPISAWSRTYHAVMNAPA